MLGCIFDIKIGNTVKFLHDMNGLRLSGARSSIAPEIATFLGCGPSNPVSQQPTSDLEVNVLLLRGADEKPLFLLVSIDALYVGRKLRNLVENEFEAVLEPEQIMICASHSHFAPMLDETKPLLGPVVEEHFERVSEILVRCISRALDDDQSAEVTTKHVRYRTNSAIYRRRVVPLLPKEGRFEWMRSQFLPSKSKKLDVESDLIEFWSGQTVVGAIWVMPCHPVGYPAAEVATSEFIGVVRNYWRESVAGAAGPLPFVFIQGASGDLRPPAMQFRQWNRLQPFVVNLVFGPTFAKFSWPAWESWVADVRQEFRQALGSGSIVLSGELSVRRWNVPLEIFFEKTWAGERNFSIQYLRLGSLEFLGLSAEVTWLCRKELLRELGRPGIVVVGCIDDCFGYLASKSQLRWGGYEVEGFLKPFSLRPARPRFQEEILRQVTLNLGRVAKSGLENP